MHYSAYAFSWNGQKTIDPKLSQLLYLFLFQVVSSQTELWFFLKAIRVIKTQNNKQIHSVRQQAVSAEACVHSQASLSPVYGD